MANNYFKPQYPQRLNASRKEKYWDDRDKRTQENIKHAQDKKEIGYAVGGAWRDGFGWCVNHPNWKKELSDIERFEWINRVTRELLESRGSEYAELAELYRNAIQPDLIEQGGEVETPEEKEIQLNDI